MVKKRPKSRPVRVSGTPSSPRDTSAGESFNDEMYAALSSITHSAPPVLMKVCRLCETKDGPFLNIFDSDKVTAKRIDEVLPFTIAENDELPHKICFRCSAKLEELYEFILKCIKTQDSLRTAMGKRVPLATKSRFRVQWEKQLNKKNISNDDICNALIKRAMEGIKDIPLTPTATEEEKPQPPPPPPVNRRSRNSIEPMTGKKDIEPGLISSKNNITYQSDESDEPDDINLRQVKLTLEKCDKKVPSTRASRFKKPEAVPDEKVEPPKPLKHYPSRQVRGNVDSPPVEIKSTSKISDKPKQSNENATLVNNDKDKSDSEKPKDVPVKEPAAPPPPPINIMDHVSSIKVNNVGTLYLCKLCNRNFLKKEVVLAHGCAKNNVPKDKFLHNAPPRDVPKPPVTVKYIKMDTDFKRSVIADNRNVVPDNKLVFETKPVVENKTFEKIPAPQSVLKVNVPVQPEVRLKPKVGPASKVKHARPAEVPKEPTPPPAKPQVVLEEKLVPAVQFPTMPSLNSRYKLVPGPNNTFTLVEDSSVQKQSQAQAPIAPVTNNSAPRPKSKKRKIVGGNEYENVSRQFGSIVPDNEPSEIIDLDDNVPPEPAVIQQPYPVGLFTTPHHSGVFAPTIPQPPTLMTPAMKKQSYTIVQTGNPSKLLISTKPQPVVEEPQRKKSKKTKPDEVEENAQPKDSGFFTFINVDPLSQPSYVLPTDNIIQESQISTSTPASKTVLDSKDKNQYSCNMCEQTFTREKKLLTHIQSHFNQMDQEDQMRAEKTGTKKKTRKS